MNDPVRPENAPAKDADSGHPNQDRPRGPDRPAPTQRRRHHQRLRERFAVRLPRSLPKSQVRRDPCSAGGGAEPGHLPTPVAPHRQQPRQGALADRAAPNEEPSPAPEASVPPRRFLRNRTPGQDIVSTDRTTYNEIKHIMEPRWLRYLNGGWPASNEPAVPTPKRQRARKKRPSAVPASKPEGTGKAPEEFCRGQSKFPYNALLLLAKICNYTRPIAPRGEPVRACWLGNAADMAASHKGACGWECLS